MVSSPQVKHTGYNSAMLTILLLTVSNIFMIFAWYGHLRYRNKPLLLVIVASWLIAFFEYCFQVPANRIGYGRFNVAELKTIQEVHNSGSVFGFFRALPERAVSLEL